MGVRATTWALNAHGRSRAAWVAAAQTLQNAPIVAVRVCVVKFATFLQEPRSHPGLFMSSKV